MKKIQCWFCNKPIIKSKTFNTCSSCEVMYYYSNNTETIASMIFSTKKVFIEISLSNSTLHINGPEGFNNLANVDLKPFLTLTKDEIINKVHKLLVFL